MASLVKYGKFNVEEEDDEEDFDMDRDNNKPSVNSQQQIFSPKKVQYTTA